MKKYVSIFGVIIVCVVIYFLSTIGWWGYEKWKYRRTTFGNKTESVERKVFVKDLEYFSSIKLENFSVYIEKGFKYGYLGDYQTRLLENDKYPYQITFIDKMGLNNISFYIINKEKFKLLSSSSITLKDAYLRDTLLIGIDKYTKQWDSIGYIKVWDKDNNVSK